MNNFRKLAIESASLSEITNGREKIPMPENEILTMVDFDLLLKDKPDVDEKTGEVKETHYAAVAIDDEHYINGGAVLTKVIRGFEAACGSLEEARKAYAESEPIQFKLTKGTTSTGRQITRVTII